MIELFDRARHGALVEGWYVARGQAQHAATMTIDGLLPPTGFVTQSAAMWLYLTNGRRAYTDHLISDPAATKEQRKADVAALLAFAYGYAAANGYQDVLSFVSAPVEPHMTAIGCSKPYGDDGFQFYAMRVRS